MARKAAWTSHTGTVDVILVEARQRSSMDYTYREETPRDRAILKYVYQEMYLICVRADAGRPGPIHADEHARR
jgi:hypothetical protein